jgi:hypothetical protein
MARARQRIISRRRVQQRIKAIADGTQNCHSFRASACSSRQTRRNAPIIVAPPCQSEIKRTLRHTGSSLGTLRSQAFREPQNGPFDADGERRVSRTGRIWFRNGGHGRLCIFFAQGRRQSKIYTESNQSVFSLTFGDLTSMQTLAIYRRLLVKDRLRDQPQRFRTIATESKRRPGSRDVFSASHGVLARAGARAIAQGEDA